jgi:hypothetical protein
MHEDVGVTEILLVQYPGLGHCRGDSVKQLKTLSSTRRGAPACGCIIALKVSFSLGNDALGRAERNTIIFIT